METAASMQRTCDNKFDLNTRSGTVLNRRAVRRSDASYPQQKKDPNMLTHTTTQNQTNTQGQTTTTPPTANLTILRHTDYRCHQCWQDLRLMPQAQWRVVAMPAKARGSKHVGVAREEHLLAVCATCARLTAFAGQAMAPEKPVAVLDAPEFAEIPHFDREDASLAAGALGLLSGWFVAGPALALVGLAAGAAAGYMSVKRLAA